LLFLHATNNLVKQQHSLQNTQKKPATILNTESATNHIQESTTQWPHPARRSRRLHSFAQPEDEKEEDSSNNSNTNGDNNKNASCKSSSQQGIMLILIFYRTTQRCTCTTFIDLASAVVVEEEGGGAFTATEQ
jgi:hypothetical protein